MTRSAPLAERALYLTLVLAALLVFGVLAGIELLERVTTRIFGFRPENDFGFGSDSGASLATVIVTGSAWLYHVAIRQRDLRAGPLTGAAAWMPRAYLYGATLAGLIFTAYNIGTLLGAATTGRVIDNLGLSPQRQAAVAIAGIVGWGIVWLGHWWYATAITRGTGWRADSERAARLRIAFYVAAIGSMALATTIFAFMALSGSLTLSMALGANALEGQPDAVDAIAKPLVSLLPWAAAWLLHRTWLFAEARTADDPARMATADRLDASVVALIGLVALGGGLTGLVHLLLNAVFGNDPAGESGNEELAFSLAAAGIGAVLWFWSWWRLQARHARAPLAEASSPVRRAYLLTRGGRQRDREPRQPRVRPVLPVRGHAGRRVHREPHLRDVRSAGAAGGGGAGGRLPRPGAARRPGSESRNGGRGRRPRLRKVRHRRPGGCWC